MTTAAVGEGRQGAKALVEGRAVTVEVGSAVESAAGRGPGRGGRGGAGCPPTRENHMSGNVTFKIETTIPGRNVILHVGEDFETKVRAQIPPASARELAKQLNDAADVAEGLRTVGNGLGPFEARWEDQD